MTPGRSRSLLLLVCALLFAGVASADWSYEPLTPAQIETVRAAIAEMKTNPRGPYLRIRWFCDDGSVLPPEPFACREHGGGHQHAEMRPEIARLGDWGFHFGTIYQALETEEFVDAANSGYRQRELVLHDYLEGVDDGWIMRRAQFYRGARQAENEEVRGRELLEELLADRTWRRGHPLLSSLLVAVVPHGAAGVPGAKMRELATRIADVDASFQPLRVKIHSTPGPGDLGAVREYLTSRRSQLDASTLALLEELTTELAQAYRVDVDSARWSAIAQTLAGTSVESEAREIASELSAADARGRIAVLADFLRLSRDALTSDLGTGRTAGRRALAILDAIHYADALIFAEASRWVDAAPAASRQQLLAVALELVDAAYGSGWLTAREREALLTETAAFTSGAEPSRAEYAQTVRYLSGAADWGLASLQQTFGPVLERYAPVEPLAIRFVDDSIRGSVLLPLSRLSESLGADAAAELDMAHRFLDREVTSGVLALNPGVAVGRLHIVDDLSEIENLDPEGIYVLPETPADLGRVAGILTLDQGSRLSHVQLLARGLGIPNASIPSSLLSTLRAREGEICLYAVSDSGSVVLVPGDAMATGDAREAQQSAQSAATFEVDTQRLDLAQRQVLPLSGVDVDDSGRTVGPKAANLGRLHGLFPDRVSPGLVIPFGVFRAHVDRDLDGDGRTLHEEIVDIFRMEREAIGGGEDPQAVRTRVLNRLEGVRRRIAGMRMLPEFRAHLEESMRERFGEPGTYGIFVRSDTNVEDLPNFSGAGLNLTVMNVIGTEAVVQAIRDVWASPFTQRSYVWRQRLIRNAEAVYPSIVLLKSVASEASGVLVTADITGSRIDGAAADGETWTVTLAQGVGGVVDGEAAETILLPASADSMRRPLLLSSARAIWKKRLLDTGAGGIVRIPVGGDETLLTPDREDDLRTVVQEIIARYPRPRQEANATGPQPWDIEFGFVDDRTVLFQIRPFITGTTTPTLEALEVLDRRVLVASGQPIDLQHTLTVESDD